MAARRRTDAELLAALRDPGFTPGGADIPGLLDGLATPDEDQRDLVARALARAGRPAAAEIARRIDAAPAVLRARWTRVLGRLAAHDEDARWTALLAARLRDDDARTRRAAAAALGKLRTKAAAEAGPALLRALEAEGEAPVRAAMVEALGRIGGEEARAAVTEAERRPELAPAAAKARLFLERAHARAIPSRVLTERDAPEPTPVLLYCRAGLEPVVSDELGPELGPRLPGARGHDGGTVPEGCVSALLRGAPARLLASRVMLRFGFPVRVRPAPPGEPAAAVADALAGSAAWAILRGFTEGPIRYRIEWAGAGKRRAATRAVAEEVARRRPELVNDPADCVWTAVVRESPEPAPPREARGRGARKGEAGAVARPRIVVDLIPTFEDTRFAYRSGDVPASSHPTIAAALARVAGVVPSDVVWDPFVGSGLELCERARAGPYKRLIGSDVDAEALEVAAANLRAVGAHDVRLVHADGTMFAPTPAPTLVITNPPMGRRVHRSRDLGQMLEGFVAHAARVLSPHGRLVWITPMPHRTDAAARRAGLSLRFARDVDMGGFRAQMEVRTRSAEHVPGLSERRPR